VELYPTHYWNWRPNTNRIQSLYIPSNFEKPVSGPIVAPLDALEAATLHHPLSCRRFIRGLLLENINDGNIYDDLTKAALLLYYCYSSQGTGVIHINFTSENNKVLLSTFPISF
jgi:hypothetical protein